MRVIVEGYKIGSLVLLERKSMGKFENTDIWLCRCECGETSEYSTAYIKKCTEKSCCKKCAKNRQRKSVTKHGMYSKDKRLASIGREMFKRCNDEKSINYKNYGGRGIKCEFDSLEHFFEWSLQNGYQGGLSIERVDVNGPYSPENCKWIPIAEQAKNKRTTPEFHGHKGLDAIAEYIGITNKTLQAYIYKKKMTFREVYDLSKNDPTFFLNHYEKNKIKAMKRKHEWALSKEDVEDILKQIENGKTKTYMARKVYKVDVRTVDKAIKRYKEGYYS